MLMLMESLNNFKLTVFINYIITIIFKNKGKSKQTRNDKLKYSLHFHQSIKRK